MAARLERSTTDKKWAGVCGGLAEYLQVDVALVRTFFVVGTVVTGGLGLLGYITILGSIAIRGETGRAVGFGIALIGFGFSMYLTYRELFTIKAICQWCVSSAVLMTLVVVLTLIRWLNYSDEPDRGHVRAAPVQ